MLQVYTDCCWMALQRCACNFYVCLLIDVSCSLLSNSKIRSIYASLLIAHTHMPIYPQLVQDRVAVNIQRHTDMEREMLERRQREYEEREAKRKAEEKEEQEQAHEQQQAQPEEPVDTVQIGM